MAFKTFKPRSEPITLAALGARIARRRAEFGPDCPEVPRNRADPVHPELVEERTESKRALLKAIEEAGGRW